MGNYREQYLTALTNRACEIMSKAEMTQQDIQFLMLYKSELRRAEYIPMFKRIMTGAKDVLAFIKNATTTDDEKVEDNNLIEENTTSNDEL